MERPPASPGGRSERPDGPRTAAALHAMTLVATLRTALGVRRGIAARRDGRDPSAQEAEARVRADLAAALARLRALRGALVVRLVRGPAEGEAALVQAFEDQLLLAEVAEEWRIAHQKLLSLFPAVSAAATEHARRAAATFADAAAGPADEATLNRLDALLLAAAQAVRAALADPPAEGA